MKIYYQLHALVCQASNYGILFVSEQLHGEKQYNQSPGHPPTEQISSFDVPRNLAEE